MKNLFVALLTFGLIGCTPDSGNQRPDIKDDTLKISTDYISGNDFLTANEMEKDLVVSAKIEGLRNSLRGVVKFNDAEYSVSVSPENPKISVTIPRTVIEKLPLGNLDVVFIFDNVSVTKTIEVVPPDAPVFTVTVAENNIVSYQERTQGFSIRGKTKVLNIGETVSAKIDSKTYIAKIQPRGEFKIDIPANQVPAENFSLKISGSDLEGNSYSNEHTINVTPPEEVIVALFEGPVPKFTDDNILNEAELGENLTLTGKLSVKSGYLVLGDYIEMAQIQPDGSFTLNLSPGWASSLNDGQNKLEFSAGGLKHEVTFEIKSRPTMIIHSVSYDDTINPVEAQHLVIKGTETTAPGGTVKVKLGGVSGSSTVDSEGSWSVSLPAISTLNFGTVFFTMEVTVKDLAGNEVIETYPIYTTNLVLELEGNGSTDISFDSSTNSLNFSGVATQGVFINNVKIRYESRNGNGIYEHTADVAGNRFTETQYMAPFGEPTDFHRFLKPGDKYDITAVTWDEYFNPVAQIIGVLEVR